MKEAIEKAMKDLEIEQAAADKQNKMKYWKKNDREGGSTRCFVPRVESIWGGFCRGTLIKSLNCNLHSIIV